MDPATAAGGTRAAGLGCGRSGAGTADPAGRLADRSAVRPDPRGAGRLQSGVADRSCVRNPGYFQMGVESLRRYAAGGGADRGDAADGGPHLPAGPAGLSQRPAAAAVADRRVRDHGAVCRKYEKHDRSCYRRAGRDGGVCEASAAGHVRRGVCCGRAERGGKPVYGLVAVFQPPDEPDPRAAAAARLCVSRARNSGMRTAGRAARQRPHAARLVHFGAFKGSDVCVHGLSLAHGLTLRPP